MPDDTSRIVRDVTVSKRDRDLLETLDRWLIETPDLPAGPRQAWHGALARVVAAYDRNGTTEIILATLRPGR